MNLKVGGIYHRKDVGSPIIRRIIEIDMSIGRAVTELMGTDHVTVLSNGASFSIEYLEQAYVECKGCLIKLEVKEWLEENK